MLMLILHYSGLNDYFEVGKDGKMMLKKKKIDLNNLTADELRALGIDPNLSAKEIAKKLKVDALWYCIQIKKLFNPFPNKRWFLRVRSTSLLKTLWEKEKLLVTSNFSFLHSVFYPFGKLFAIFINFEIVVFKLFQFGSLKFVVWERLKLWTDLAFES